MYRFLSRILFTIIFFGIFHSAVLAQDTGSTYSVGVVERIEEQTEIRQGNDTFYTQRVVVRDEQTGTTSTTSVGSTQLPVAREQLYTLGQRVVLITPHAATETSETVIADQYRIPALLALVVAFIVIVILLSGRKGVTSLLGMGASVAVLVFYMVPTIISGTNPFLVSLFAAGLISALIIYLGHGFHYRSHIALFCMMITLSSVAALSAFVVHVAALSGLGDENAIYVQIPGVHAISLQGLLLGGIVLAALSVLDDSVVSQVSVLHQLKSAKKDISLRELSTRGMVVGRDHISTLVNTLVLAYAGASLPLFILITTNSTGQPLWYTINNQMIAEEIVRTLTGSIGLVLSIPLTTLVAAYVLQKRGISDRPEKQDHHH